jgi:hypothetical protein
MRAGVLRSAPISALLVAVACSIGPKGPSRETLLPLLQKEADSLKADGEKPMPSLGVESTWTIEGLDLKEQPANESNPWAGTVRFKIVTRTKDFDGSIATDETLKQFEYLWSTALSKWVFQYKPTPAPAKKG